MLKYTNSDVVFQEIPDEVALAINLSGCPCRCPGCHSPQLWGDIGEPLTPQQLDDLIAECRHHITCVALMGGDAAPDEVDNLMQHLRQQHGELQTAWYSGRSLLSPAIHLENVDYVKLGPYLAHLGPLRSKRTNQRFYHVQQGQLHDITSRFWQR